MNPTEIEAGKSYRGTDGVVRKVDKIYPFEFDGEYVGTMVRYSVDERGMLTMPLWLFSKMAKEEV